MKKFLAGLALAALTLLTVSAVAQAAPVWVTKNLMIRDHRAAYWNGFADSSVFSRNSAGSEAALLSDTTAWFTLPGRANPSSAVQVGADSIMLFQLRICPDGDASTSAADSFNVLVQGSNNNGTSLVAGVAIDILEAGSSDCFERTFNSTYGASAPATGTNVTMGYYDQFRVIVKDFTGTTGQFKVSVKYLYDGSADPTGTNATR